MEDHVQYNQNVKDWGTGTLTDIKQEADQFDIKHRSNSKSQGSSIKALKVAFTQANSEIKKISFKIRQTLIFVHKGVGKDTPISKAGSTNRTPKPFINDPIDKKIDALADIVAEHSGDIITNNILIH